LTAILKSKAKWRNPINTRLEHFEGYFKIEGKMAQANKYEA